MFKKSFIPILFLFLILLLFPFNSEAQKLLIPMDFSQKDHLKAYGVAYWCLRQGYTVEWLLNYRSGSFIADYREEIADRCRLQGVTFENINLASAGSIYQEIEENNMEVVLLEKAPAIAVYVPPTKEPWDDAVRLALAYAEIPYKTLWDVEVLKGELEKYDWLHLHHEDFTGQYGKFYANFRNELWYREEQRICKETARSLGFDKVSEEKKTVARVIKDYVARGGFLFAVCSAPETIDIALSAEKVDIVPREFDGDPPDVDCQNKLDYSRTFAFTDFTLSLNPMEYRHSDIDTQPDRLFWGIDARNDYFTLFDFSAKLDPVPSMLVQNHVNVVAGFMGQTTAFRKSLLKKYVTILAEVEGVDEVRYIHGNFGRGTFTFLSGHDPEDYEHRVGDPPTDLNLHKNSPGYRLILNNILFPAAKKKERKT
ncbi:MAG: asparagine synthetase B [candidate division Zixibacteria bacterium]|nr:asparagine synthetase B [candidate division Zixibacteria bacterium]